MFRFVMIWTKTEDASCCREVWSLNSRGWTLPGSDWGDFLGRLDGNSEASNGGFLKWRYLQSSSISRWDFPYKNHPFSGKTMYGNPQMELCTFNKASYWDHLPWTPSNGRKTGGRYPLIQAPDVASDVNRRIKNTNNDDSHDDVWMMLGLFVFFLEHRGDRVVGLKIMINVQERQFLLRYPQQWFFSLKTNYEQLPISHVGSNQYSQTWLPGERLQLECQTSGGVKDGVNGDNLLLSWEPLRTLVNGPWFPCTFALNPIARYCHYVYDFGG